MAVKSMTLNEFVTKLIPYLRKANTKYPNAKGVHSVFSGFNDAVRAYIAKTSGKAVDTIERSTVYEALDSLIEEKKLYRRPVKKGFLMYLPKDWKAIQAQSTVKSAESILDAIM